VAGGKLFLAGADWSHSASPCTECPAYHGNALVRQRFAYPAWTRLRWRPTSSTTSSIATSEWEPPSPVRANGPGKMCCDVLRWLVRRALARYHRSMQSFTAVIERDEATGLFVGYVPGWPGAHSQGTTLDELRQNLEEVVAMLLEDGGPKLEGEFVGTQMVRVA